MIYLGIFIRQMISFSHFTQIMHNIEDELYSVDLGQEMAPRLIKEINFNCFILLFLAFLWKTCKYLEKKNLWLKDLF